MLRLIDFGIGFLLGWCCGIGFAIWLSEKREKILKIKIVEQQKLP